MFYSLKATKWKFFFRNLSSILKRLHMTQKKNFNSQIKKNIIMINLHNETSVIIPYFWLSGADLWEGRGNGEFSSIRRKLFKTNLLTLNKKLYSGVTIQILGLIWSLIILSVELSQCHFRIAKYFFHNWWSNYIKEHIDGVAQKGPIWNFDEGRNRYHAFKRIR